jgi:hypothetical protein
MQTYLPTTGELRLSPEECDAAVWVPLEHLPQLLDADHHGHYGLAAGAGESATKGASGGQVGAAELPAGYPRALCATQHGYPCGPAIDFPKGVVNALAGAAHRQISYLN